MQDLTIWSLMCIDTDRALFVKPVFRSEHLTNLQRGLFSPFCFFHQAWISLRSSEGKRAPQLCQGAHRPQTTQGEVLGAYTDTPPNEASR